MNVASLENCKELYELSGWEVSTDTMHWYTRLKPSKDGMFIAPKYDLGFLLRKLPEIDGAQWDLGPSIDGRNLIINYARHDLIGIAATPEDATAKLCVTLFKKGVLKREDSL